MPARVALPQLMHRPASVVWLAEQLGEWACRHASADVLSVPGIVEEMGVCIEGDGDPCVAEDAADLCDVEPKIDDQMAGKGVALMRNSA